MKAKINNLMLPKAAEVLRERKFAKAWAELEKRLKIKGLVNEKN